MMFGLCKYSFIDLSAKKRRSEKKVCNTFFWPYQGSEPKTGYFAVLKNEKKSQIDLGDVTLFKIFKTNWHMSGHRPIQLNIQMETIISCAEILTRAENP